MLYDAFTSVVAETGDEIGTIVPPLTTHTSESESTTAVTHPRAGGCNREDSGHGVTASCHHSRVILPHQTTSRDPYHSPLPMWDGRQVFFSPRLVFWSLVWVCRT